MLKPPLSKLTKPLFFFMAYSLSGCSVMRSYNDELTQTIDLVSKNQTAQAIQHLESNNTSTDKDLLYYLEKGELLRLTNNYKDSTDTWLLADQKVNEWENEAKIRAGALLENVGTVLLNDKTRRYDGHDYEKVMLTTHLALDHLLLGDWDKARTEIKKTHEREAIIEEIRGKETAKLEEESKAKGVTTTFKDLNGYPVATLDTPEIVGMKNGYQSAFSHYLAGFVYEALNEPSLASPGYRKAIELQPNISLLEEGLSALDTRLGQRKPTDTDVLLIVESGTAPSLSSIMIPLPVLVANLGVIPISFPLLHSDPSHTSQASEIGIDGSRNLPLIQITSLDAMSRRALRDDMPGIIFRGVLRAAAKATSQKVLRDQGGYAAIAGIALNVANVITESADERTWRTLPSTISIARTSLPSGMREFAINAGGVSSKKSVEIKGSHAIVVARVIGNQVFWSTPEYSSQMPVYIAPPAIVEPSKDQEKADKKPKSRKKKSTKTTS